MRVKEIEPDESRLALTSPGAPVLCGVAIDQGGCAETSRAKTHTNAVYSVDGVIHYCVAKMAGVEYEPVGQRVAA